MEDHEIINRVKQGVPEAFSRLVEKYHRPLLRYIYFLLRDETVVEDIGQEVFLSAYLALSDFDLGRGTPFSAWLFIAARNRCFSEMRKRRNKVFISIDDVWDIPVSNKSSLEMVIDREQKQALEEALQKLPDPYRKTLLKDLEGLSLEEIAGLDEVSSGTVKSRLFRARQRVKGLLTRTITGVGYEKI